MTSGEHNEEANGGPRPTPVPPARPIPTLADDVTRCLLEPPRSIPPKYFYDARGSELFDAICETPEYYPTRTERRLLETSAPAIMRRARPDHLLELGSGNSAKTRLLLDAWDAARQVYWPFDVSESALREAAGTLMAEYASLEVRPLVGDYSGGFANLPAMPGRVMVAFLGGTIGNLPPANAVAFLTELADWMDDDDALLVGLDRVKERAVLEAAYNDAAGITAEFNLNVLNVLNRELDANFDPGAFRHEARYDAEQERIEMYLIAESDQTVELKDLSVTLAISRGERILTEISRKFTMESLTSLFSDSGLSLHEHFQPDDGWYSLVLAGKD